MLVQHFIVGFIVALCAIGASWNLMPQAARRACARAALRLPWPAPLATRWQRAAVARSGCDGCKHSGAVHGATTPLRPTTIHIVRKAARERN